MLQATRCAHYRSGVGYPSDFWCAADATTCDCPWNGTCGFLYCVLDHRPLVRAVKLGDGSREAAIFESAHTNPLQGHTGQGGGYVAGVGHP